MMRGHRAGELQVRLFVHRQVIEDDDIAGAERRGERLLDGGEKRGMVDPAVEDRGRGRAVDRRPAMTGCVCQCPHGV